jgi:hypothetical protein
MANTIHKYFTRLAPIRYPGCLPEHLPRGNVGRIAKSGRYGVRSFWMVTKDVPKGEKCPRARRRRT